jgi:hypothetical protein
LADCPALPWLSDSKLSTGLASLSV